MVNGAVWPNLAKLGTALVSHGAFLLAAEKAVRMKFCERNASCLHRVRGEVTPGVGWCTVHSIT